MNGFTLPTPKIQNRNFFKNPAFSVIQGTASGTLANSLALPTASLGYLGETEWGIAASGGTPTYTFNDDDETVTFAGAAGTTAIYFLQRLESKSIRRLRDKTVTFSVKLSNSLLTSVIWEAFRPTSSKDAHGTIASPTQTLIASGTFTVNSTLTKYSATFALPTLVSRGLEIRLRVGAQTSGTWVISQPQLEEGSLATDFNCKNYLAELRECERYYRIIESDQFQYLASAAYFIVSIPCANMFSDSKVLTTLDAITYSGSQAIDSFPRYVRHRCISGGAGMTGGYLRIGVSTHIP